MTERDKATGNSDIHPEPGDARPSPGEAWQEQLEQRLEVESLCQIVESIDQWGELDRRLNGSLSRIHNKLRSQDDQVHTLQRLLREALMDVELLKRAAVTGGQIGVVQRKQMEKNLVRELFPPESKDARGLGLKVQAESTPVRGVDCENRLHLCKAACCRIFASSLTPAEVASERYEWDPKLPYTLRRDSKGCTYLSKGGCQCTVYNDRPRTCSTYSCANDTRIWKNFEAYELQPELAAQLSSLDVSLGTPGAGSTPTGSPPAVRPNPESQILDQNSALLADPATKGVPPSSGASAASPSDDKPVSPPDFSDLRSRLAPQPRVRFMPGSPGSKDGDSGRKDIT